MEPRTGDPVSCVWEGLSGQRYTYWIFALPTEFTPGVFVNFIFAKPGPSRVWVPVYIGEGDLALNSALDQGTIRCIRAKGATHFHCHPNRDPGERRRESQDLQARFWAAFEPQGCNDSRERQPSGGGPA